MTEPKHQLTIELIEREIAKQVGLRDYFTRLSETWPNMSEPFARCDAAIASLQQTREILVLIRG